MQPHCKAVRVRSAGQLHEYISFVTFTPPSSGDVEDGLVAVQLTDGAVVYQTPTPMASKDLSRSVPDTMKRTLEALTDMFDPNAKEYTYILDSSNDSLVS